VQIKKIEISTPANYQMLIRAEEIFGVSPEARWPLPTLVVGKDVLTGDLADRFRGVSVRKEE
jgi:hypothetical protein